MRFGTHFGWRGWLPALTIALWVSPALWAQESDNASGTITMTDKDGNKREVSREEAVQGIIRGCKDNPQQKACADLRQACEQKRPNWPGDMARICPELVGSGGGGGGISAEQLGQDDGGETFGEPRPRDSNEATLDKVARMCRREPNTKMCVQVRGQCEQKYANLPPGGQRLCRQIGVVAGLRGSGITQGELATAWGVPVEVHATYAVAPRLSVLGYVRPIWHFGETPRVDDATIGSFADEFELGANVVWAQVTKPGVSKFGLLAGVVYHELRDTAYVGIRVGAGYANRP